MSRRTRAGLLLVGIVGLNVAGCHADTSDPVVDGWPVGPLVDCSAPGGVLTAGACPEYLSLASIQLDERDPGHAEVAAITLHQEGFVLDADGHRMIREATGASSPVIARFELADGTVQAIGIVVRGILDDPRTTVAVDHGPYYRWWRFEP